MPAETAQPARDLREGGAWSLGQRVKNDVLFALVTIVLAITTRLPRSWLRGLGRALGVVAWVLVPSARHLACANVARAFPDRPPEACRDLARASYRELGIHLGDAVAMLGPSPCPLDPLPFAPGARAIFDEALAEGHGVVFASAHLGPWERVAATLVAAGLPLTVVGREAYDPRFTRLYERLRGGHGVRAIYRGAPGAAAGLVRTLRKGHILGIPMDLTSRVRSIDVPFLGAPAPTPVGPARIALRTGAAVVVGTAAPSADGLVFAASRVRTDDLGSADCDRVTNEQTLTARINEALSGRIRALPHAWVWMHDRWRASGEARPTL